MTTAIAVEVPQHLAALARANAVRIARADLKKAVTHGQVSVATIVMEVPWEAETMPVLDLLMAQRRWGLTRSRRFLLAFPMSETKTIGSLTARQRELFCQLIAGSH